MGDYCDPCIAEVSLFYEAPSKCVCAVFFFCFMQTLPVELRTVVYVYKSSSWCVRVQLYLGDYNSIVVQLRNKEHYGLTERPQRGRKIFVPQPAHQFGCGSTFV